MPNLVHGHSTRFMSLSILLLALPALFVQLWLANQFPSYLGWRFAQGALFSLLICTFLVLISHWRLFGPATWPVSSLVYMAWLFLVFSEAVSYYLQADTFNDRFFANLSPHNFSAGVHAFPAMIGGGLALLMLIAVFAAQRFRKLARPGAASPSLLVRAGWMLLLVAVLLVLDSAPRRLAHYVVRYEKSFAFADTQAGRAVSHQLDLTPTTRRELVAAPGKNVVVLYMESLERMYLDPSAFPGLTPNLDRLRARGLDFSGLETFSGATYTIAGMFASQCGSPLFSSPFAAFDYAAGNNNDATTFHPKLVCLGDVLSAAGYQQVYMGGAPSSFSNKGLFYMLHGYDSALGLEELEVQSGDKLEKKGWGLYDQDLFRLALDRYHRLAKSGKPFNLSLITLDTHPPHGRPSPDCPRYSGSSNDMLQSVHCTDYLVGKFIDQMSKDPAWKNTVVMVMSDHLAMRNDSESEYPKGYHRQPLLFFLNAGQGTRNTRIYHMDVAPTLLSLMKVRTNATFLAGSDRSAPNAEENPLVDSEVADSVIRQTLWSYTSEFKLCKKNVLVGWGADNGFEMGGRDMHLSHLGEAEVALNSDQVLTFFVGPTNASMLMVDRDNLEKVLAGRGEASALTVRPLAAGSDKANLFAIDWVGLHGAVAHIARVPRLQGLAVSSPNCGELIAKVDAAKRGQVLDYSKEFNVTTAPRYGAVESLPADVDFIDDSSTRPHREEIGWFPVAAWGSWTVGDWASLSFTLPRAQCHAANFEFNVRPFVPKSRPRLDVRVMSNGKQMAVWHFSNKQKASQQVSTLVKTDDAECHVDLRFEFSRPEAQPPPYPAGEDGRALQLDFVHLRITAPPTDSSNVRSAVPVSASD